MSPRCGQSDLLRLRGVRRDVVAFLIRSSVQRASVARAADALDLAISTAEMLERQRKGTEPLFGDGWHLKDLVGGTAFPLTRSWRRLTPPNNGSVTRTLPL